MIIGNDTNELNRYIGISKNLDFAIHYILNHDLLLLQPNKYQLDDNEVILIREDYEVREIENCYFEGHESYLDIQIVLQGKEGFGYCHINNSDLKVTDAYNSDKDVKKYQARPEFIYEMNDGSFAVVFPEDLHMPKIKISQNLNVKKAIFKVKL